MDPLDDLADLVPRQIARGLASGDLQPTPTRQHFLEEAGLRFSVRVIDGVDRKKRSRTEQDRTGVDPFMPPYADDLFVADVSPTHVVLLNKFPVLENHLLVVTRADEPQESALTDADFTALGACMGRLGGLGFYNAGPVAGASQPHKHLQWIPLSGDVLETAELLREPGRGFACASVALSPEVPRVEAYRELLARLEIAATDPYNLLLTRDEMFVVPRTRHACEGFALNAMGYAGSFLVRTTDDLERLKEVGARNVLAGAGRPE